MAIRDEEIRMLLDASDRLVSSVSCVFWRYMSSRVDWQEKMSYVKGPKGTGKTTLILQHIKETFGAGSDKAFGCVPPRCSSRRSRSMVAA